MNSLVYAQAAATTTPDDLKQYCSCNNTCYFVVLFVLTSCGLLVCLVGWLCVLVRLFVCLSVLFASVILFAL